MIGTSQHLSVPDCYKTVQVQSGQTTDYRIQIRKALGKLTAETVPGR
jgi:hypothetical protein